MRLPSAGRTHDGARREQLRLGRRVQRDAMATPILRLELLQRRRYPQGVVRKYLVPNRISSLALRVPTRYVPASGVEGRIWGTGAVPIVQAFGTVSLCRPATRQSTHHHCACRRLRSGTYGTASPDVSVRVSGPLAAMPHAEKPLSAGHGASGSFATQSRVKSADCRNPYPAPQDRARPSKHRPVGRAAVRLSNARQDAEDPRWSVQASPGNPRHLLFANHLCRLNPLSHRPRLRPAALEWRPDAGAGVDPRRSRQASNREITDFSAKRS